MILIIDFHILMEFFFCKIMNENFGEYFKVKPKCLKIYISFLQANKIHRIYVNVAFLTYTKILFEFCSP